MNEPNRGWRDRAAGSIIGTAVGDALGAPYEFGSRRPGVILTGTEADMRGGNGWEPGEWTDDTAMAIGILRPLSDGHVPGEDLFHDAVVAEWFDWARTAKDLGIQTSKVFRGMGEPTAQAARESARRVHGVTGRSAGNGAVMRTAPVGLAYLYGKNGLEVTAHAAREIAELTHPEEDARQAAALWSMLIYQAVHAGWVNVDQALSYLPDEQADRWRALLDEAEGADPDSFEHNGWVVHAVQAAWAAIHAGGIRPWDRATATPENFRLAMNAAMDIHNDTDTVAAIAGGLAGALVGVSGIPLGWQRRLHGWGGPGGEVLRSEQLVKLAVRAAAGDDGSGWLTGPRVTRNAHFGKDTLVRHPHDSGVWLGGVLALNSLPDAVAAVVSLCQLGAEEVPARIGASERAAVWLIDGSREANPHLDFVMAEAADAVASLRAEGHEVFLHCVAAESRTPSVAVAYAVRHLGVASEVAAADVAGVLGEPIKNTVLAAAAEGVEVHDE